MRDKIPFLLVGEAIAFGAAALVHAGVIGFAGGGGANWTAAA